MDKSTIVDCATVMIELLQVKRSKPNNESLMPVHWIVKKNKIGDSYYGSLNSSYNRNNMQIHSNPVDQVPSFNMQVPSFKWKLSIESNPVEQIHDFWSSDSEDRTSTSKQGLTLAIGFSCLHIEYTKKISYAILNTVLSTVHTCKTVSKNKPSSIHVWCTLRCY